MLMDSNGHMHNEDKPQYITKEQKRKFYNSGAWARIRRKALERDRYECVWCRDKGQVTTGAHATLEIDHVKELEDYPDLALDLDNLQTLCRRHHNMKHNRLQFRPKKKPNKWADDELFD
jgi:5-methylcytosine-specific restriction enzyme A